jgi:hypothetical protein
VYSIDRQGPRVQGKTPCVLFFNGSTRSAWKTHRTCDASLADIRATRLDCSRRYSFRVAACSVMRDIHSISRETNVFSFATCRTLFDWTSVLDWVGVDKKNQLDVTFVFFISLLIVAQHVSGNHVSIIRS